MQIYCFTDTDANQHFILQVYLDVFSVVVIVLGGALACYGKHSILLMCMVCHYYHIMSYMLVGNFKYYTPSNCMHSLVDCLLWTEVAFHLFMCVSLVDLSFTLVANACLFLSYSFGKITTLSAIHPPLATVALHSCTSLIWEWSFSIITFILLRFSFWSYGHVGAVLFSKMSKVRSETVSTEKWKVYLAQNHSYCGLHFVLLNLDKNTAFCSFGSHFWHMSIV